MMNSSSIVAKPSTRESSAARSLDETVSANVLIIGLIVWNSVPPTSIGALMADRPVMNVRMVTANRLGSSTGSTTRRRI